jgi:hypothetical protein
VVAASATTACGSNPTGCAVAGNVVAEAAESALTGQPFNPVSVAVQSAPAVVARTPNKYVPPPEPQFKKDGVTPNRKKAATYVNVLDNNGNVVTFCSGGGRCAEDNAQAQFPGNSMSTAWGWRGPKERPVWSEIPVCKENCQNKYPPALFSPGTKAAPGGAWTKQE